MEEQGRLVENDLGESYALNAYTESTDDENAPYPISPEKQKLLEEVEPHIKKWFASLDKGAFKQLKALRKAVIKLNEDENKARTESGIEQVPNIIHAPNVLLIEREGNRLHGLIESLRGSSQDAMAAENVKSRIERQRDGFRDYLESLEFPSSWLYDMPNLTFASAESQQSSAGNTQTGNSSAPAGSNTRNGQSGNPPTGMGSATEQSSSGEMDVDYVAGQTTKEGRKILAFKVTSSYNRNLKNWKETVPSGNEATVRFVVERPGLANPISIINYYDAGIEAAEAYMDAHAEDKTLNLVHLSAEYGKQHRSQFRGILGVAIEGGNGQGSGELRRRMTVVKAQMGEQKVLFYRSTLEKIFNAKYSDDLVNNFLEGANESAYPRINKNALLMIDNGRQYRYGRQGYLDYPVQGLEYPNYYDLNPETYPPLYRDPRNPDLRRPQNARARQTGPVSVSGPPPISASGLRPEAVQLDLNTRANNISSTMTSNHQHQTSVPASNEPINAANLRLIVAEVVQQSVQPMVQQTVLEMMNPIIQELRALRLEAPNQRA